MPVESEAQLSSYFQELESDEIKQRYISKIHDINGIDPYTLKKSDWCENVEKFPEITWPDLVMYLVFGINEFTIDRDQFKAFKSLEAYNQFVSGWVRDIVVKEFPEKSLNLLSCRVLHSQRLSATALQPWVIAEEGGTIRSAHCNCMAGLGETCTHVASLLFAVEFYTRQREKQTVTQTKAYWLVPSVRKADYAEASEIDFTSAKTKKKTLDAGSSSAEKPSRPKKPLPPPPSTTETQDFLRKIHSSGIKPAILSILDPYADEYVPKIASEKYPQPLSNMKAPNLHGKPYNEVIAHCKTVEINVTKEQVKEVEADSRDQAQAKLWFEQRAGRITASRMKSACHTDPRMPSKSLIQTICYPNLYKFSSVATTWGCDHEKDACKEYEEYMSTEHRDVLVRESGLVICREHPHIGASPDGFIQCSCCGSGCIEIKCPFCAKDSELSNVADNNKNFCLHKGIDGNLMLKRDHAYYYQIQTQIHVTKTEYCDFVLWTPGEVHYERILPDPTFWSRIVKMATQFFRMCILPELLAQFYTQKTTINATPEQQDFCYCRSAIEPEGMFVCDNELCRHRVFHEECLGYKDLILTDYNKKRKRWTCPECSRFPSKKRLKE